jgi:hypothetical protein
LSSSYSELPTAVESKMESATRATRVASDPFRALRQGLSKRSISGLVATSLGHVGRPPRGPIAASELVRRFRATTGAEEEGACTPAGQLAAGLPLEGEAEEILTQAAKRYVRSTRFLFPWLHDFACAVSRVAGGRTVYLFLRDGLAFWPALRAIGQPTRFLFYTRAHRRAGQLPLVRTSSGRFVPVSREELDAGVLVDAGLYGTLIEQMIRSGCCGERPWVLFLGSRNPNITGWLNVLLGRWMLRNPDRAAILIRLVDSVESLLKPFRPAAEGERIPVEADPASFCCYAAFARASYLFSRRIGRRTHPLGRCLDAVAEAELQPDAWLLPEAVEKWAEAGQFLARWTAGPLPPMDRLSGAAL